MNILIKYILYDRDNTKICGNIGFFLLITIEKLLVDLLNQMIIYFIFHFMQKLIMIIIL